MTNRERAILAMSEVHSGNREEAEKILNVLENEGLLKIMLPKEKALKNDINSPDCGNEWRAGWNACVNEVKRLNKVA